MMKNAEIVNHSSRLFILLHCGDPNRDTIMDGICQKYQQRHDADGSYDDYEQNKQ